MIFWNLRTLETLSPACKAYSTPTPLLVTLSTLQPQAPGYDEEAEDSAMIMKSYFNLTRLVKDYPGVESATPVLGFAYPNSTGNANTSIRAEGDTLDLPVMIMEFIPHTNFFETYGFRSGRGRTPAELSDYDYTENDIVMTENTAEHLFHTKMRVISVVGPERGMIQFIRRLLV